LDLPPEIGTPLNVHSSACATPAMLLAPLDPCRLGDARPAVKAGDTVRAGDALGEAGGLAVFAPADGTVTRITQCTLASAALGPASVPAVELATAGGTARSERLDDDRNEDSAEQAFRRNDWLDATPDALLDRIAEAGLTTLADPPAPLADWCRRARAAGVDTIIANAVDGQPYLAGRHRTLVEFGRDVVEGLTILMRAIGATSVTLAVDRRHTEAYRTLVPHARRRNIQPAAVIHKYPAGNDTILMYLLTGRETPLGGSMFDAGAAVVSAAACLDACRAIAADAKPAGRIVTVAGEGVDRPGNYFTLYGTPAAALLAEADAPRTARVIHGGPLTGAMLGPDAVVGPGTDALLAVAPDKPAHPRACIRCGWCTDHCPVRLDVANLNDLYELGQVERAERCGVLACIGCGVCSYVCPARLPLAHRAKSLSLAARQLAAAKT
jgi:electron transport complex protein RnfC